MNCLHCGWCCQKMSPVSTPDPCPHLVEHKTPHGVFVLCGTYKTRPFQCKNHSFPSRACPVGMNVLGIISPDELRIRIDVGYALATGRDKFLTGET